MHYFTDCGRQPSTAHPTAHTYPGSIHLSSRLWATITVEWWLMSYRTRKKRAHSDTRVRSGGLRRRNTASAEFEMQVCALDSSQTIAVSQQLTAWAALVAGEGGWAWQRMSPSSTGRPALAATAMIAGSTVTVCVRAA